MAVTSAFLQSLGTQHVSIDLLTSIERGWESSLPRSLIILGGIPSGPCALEPSNPLSLLSTAAGVTLMSAIDTPFDFELGDNDGMLPKSSMQYHSSHKHHIPIYAPQCASTYSDTYRYGRTT
eukprot:TRINITY_DN49785_c0_g1_i1.p1 TRINITY_DN49785_c0_g1~~TRINITY_DN49785_c0_g1_i1.p1  ORF type:complete len:122 (+),score=1.44 TRINITY_DN49785_c0_g1_i1:143-508(+)